MEEQQAQVRLAKKMQIEEQGARVRFEEKLKEEEGQSNKRVNAREELEQEVAESLATKTCCRRDCHKKAEGINSVRKDNKFRYSS